MRILQLTPRIPYPPDDGGKIVIFESIKRLAMRGHKITLLSFIPNNNVDFSYLKRYCKLETVELNISDSYVKMLFNLFSLEAYTISKYRRRSLLIKLKKLLESEWFDIVHIDSLHMAYYGRFIKKNNNLPVILREHNVESTIWERYYKGILNPLVRSYVRIQFNKVYKYESKIVEDFDRCFMITAHDKERIERMNKKVKASVTPAGVDTSYFLPMAVEKEPYSIVFVASMDWIPNIEGIIWFYNDIFPLIKRKTPQSKLYIIGKNPPYIVKRLQTHDVVITGFVDDVRKYMAISSVFIVPLKTGGGMRIKILNALAMGKPVVSTSVGCEGIEVRDGEHLYIANTAKEFAHKVIELLNDSHKCKQIGEAGMKLVREKYNWERMVELLEKQYSEVLEEKAQSRREK